MFRTFDPQINGENIPHLETTAVVLFHFNIVNNDYRDYHDSTVLNTYIPNKYFGQLLHFSPKNAILSKNLIQNLHILKFGL